ncbi:hypothetical protein [Neobacillus sp. LXY-4]|uniref:hypothetical protein n=1 Tax=Neobacillus sp. LXY-4 TaxID=3379826 RepID=UPI003EE2DF7D
MVDIKLSTKDLIERKMGGVVKNPEYLDLPDLYFFLWCQKKYKLNKGIYNTIDKWFYDQGVVPIILRRRSILAFLEFVKKEDHESNHHDIIRFGSGGLSIKLKHFLESNHPYTA